jgi:hypothetical protein
MRRDGEKVIASADRVAKFGDQLVAGIRPRLVVVDRRFFSPRVRVSGSLV